MDKFFGDIITFLFYLFFRNLPTKIKLGNDTEM